MALSQEEIAQAKAAYKYVDDYNQPIGRTFLSILFVSGPLIKGLETSGSASWLLFCSSVAVAYGAWQYSRSVRQRYHPSVAYLQSLLERDPAGFDAAFPPIDLSLRNQLRNAHARDKILGQRAII